MPLLLIRNIFKNIFFKEDIGLVECDREIVEIDMRELRLILRSYENIEDLNSMKEYVYNDSFRMFCEFYNDILLRRMHLATQMGTVHNFVSIR